MSELRAKFTVARDHYHVSGKHNAENVYDEFWRFCEGDARVLYAFCTWGDEMQNFWDRRLDGDIQADTFDEPEVLTPRRFKLLKRRKSSNSSDRKRARNVHNELESRVVESTERFHTDVAEFMQQANARMQRQDEVSRLRMIIDASWADPDDIAKAKTRLTELLFM